MDMFNMAFGTQKSGPGQRERFGINSIEAHSKRITFSWMAVNICCYLHLRSLAACIKFIIKLSELN